MSRAEVIRTPHQALACAITRAFEEPLGHRLSRVSFGRFAEAGAGWYWTLEFTRKFGNVGHNDPEVMERRVSTIIDSWETDLARYAAEESPVPEAAR